MASWSERIPAAIAEAKRLLDGEQYVLIPPHIGGNETKLTLVLTAGEVGLAEVLHTTYQALGDDVWPDVLTAFAEKIERLKHD